jgi:hypothetical protein
MRDPQALPKGLTLKYAVRMPDPECVRLKAFKIEYAQGEDGRTWRRIYREHPHGYNRLHWSSITRWHIADPYEWFPAPNIAEQPGVRRQNTLARVPALDVYLIKGEFVILPRPQPTKKD